jgi:hypothetical protein
VNVAKATEKLKEQAHVLSGKPSTALPRAASRFLEEAIFGIQARQSLRLSEVEPGVTREGSSYQDYQPFVAAVEPC